MWKKFHAYLTVLKENEFLLKLEGKLNEELSDMWQ